MTSPTPSPYLDNAGLAPAGARAPLPETRLEAIVTANVEAATSAAVERLGADDDLVLLRSQGASLANLYARHADVIARARADRNLSEDGRKAAVLAADRARDAELDDIASKVVGPAGDRVLNRFPAPAATAFLPDAATAPVAAYVAAAVPNLLPTDVLEQAVALLSQALAAPTAEARVAANQVLPTYAQLLRRYSQNPPSHWRPHTERASAVAGIIGDHLDAVAGGVGHRLAAETVKTLRSDFHWVRGASAKLGKFDALAARTGAPALAWPAPPGAR